MNNYFGAMLRYFEFGGRSTRNEYWWFVLTTIALLFIAVVVDIKYLGSESFRTSPLMWFVIFTHTVPSITALVRRLHDAGHTGWWYFLGFLPLGGFLLFYFTLQGPTDDADVYGPDPRFQQALAAMRLERHQPLTRAQLMVQQMEERRRRIST